MKLYEPITLFLAVLFLGGIVIGEILERKSQPVIEYEEDCRYWSDIGGEKAWIGEDCGG